MNSFGKTIRLFLIEGNINSLVTAELSNWTGIGIKVPKIKVKDYAARVEFQKPGIYILIGKDDNNEDAAYIGEAENIYERLVSHIANKEFWNEVVFFTSKDKYLNKASVKYLEHRLHDIALVADRYKLSNQNTPTRSELSEAEQAELEEFLSNIKLLTATLGHKIFETLEATLETGNNNNQVFYCKNGAGANAKGTPSTEGFIVFKGALLIIQEQASLSKSMRVDRKKMLDEGTLIIQGELYYLTKDVVFNSPSRSASTILARSASGPLEWKTEAGVQLQSFE